LSGFPSECYSFSVFVSQNGRAFDHAKSSAICPAYFENGSAALLLHAPSAAHVQLFTLIRIGHDGIAIRTQRAHVQLSSGYSTYIDSCLNTRPAAGTPSSQSHHHLRGEIRCTQAWPTQACLESCQRMNRIRKEVDETQQIVLFTVLVKYNTVLD
jgi:hypothetical protein